MNSLDIYFLYTNISLDETIDNCIDSFCNNIENIPKIPNDVFHNLLDVATKESLYMFNKNFYKYIGALAMRSALGSSLAKVFMRSFES